MLIIHCLKRLTCTDTLNLQNNPKRQASSFYIDADRKHSDKIISQLINF